MTPEDAARAVGITIDHIKGIEAGTLKVDTTTLERICRAVGLSRLRLITGLDEADINKVSAKVEEDTEMLIILRGLSKKRQEIWKRRFGANV
jgi:transcriptional regulator with XRE-family HTH domain